MHGFCRRNKVPKDNDRQREATTLLWLPCAAHCHGLLWKYNATGSCGQKNACVRVIGWALLNDVLGNTAKMVHMNSLHYSFALVFVVVLAAV